MAYKQYSDYAYTGNQESYKNRIQNNAFDTNYAEEISFPYKYDVFVNKENTTEGPFSVTESHISSQIDGGVLYLDHRFAVDATGGIASVTCSDGSATIVGYDTYVGSIEFGVEPTTSPFTITYSARGDKTWDSHINAVQNAVMRIENTIGLHDNDPAQTGLISLPLVTTWEPANQADLDNMKLNTLKNIVLLEHLQDDIKIGSTRGAITSTGPHTITIGNPGGADTDSIVIDAASITVNSSNTDGGTLIYSASTGDFVYFTGQSEFASQMTIGKSWAVTGLYSGVIPSHMTGFYNDAMLRVNGNIYFGGNMSGNGSITFVLSTGEMVDVVGGNMYIDNLTVDSSLTVNAPSTFSKRLYVQGPGYFETNNDITLTNKTNYSPTKIDGLDPSYADAAVNSNAMLPGTIGTPIYKEPFDGTDYSNPYISGAKEHPILRSWMYPMLGGWMFTGTVNYEKASYYSHKNVLLVNANMRAASGGYGDVDDYFTYCPGLFSPGDTYIEIENSTSDAFAYPIYYHEALTGTVSTVVTATGLNLYVVADDDAFEGATIAGSTYRLFQPSNAPMGYLSGWGGATTSPNVSFGVQSYSYYGGSTQKTIDIKTHPSHIGPSAGATPWPIYRRIKNNSILTCSVKTALQRNIDHEGISDLPGGYGDITTPINGIAYIYAASHNSYGTLDENVTLIASPSPYGICAENTWGVGLNLNPGQWTIVGEVAASTSDGNTWTHIETVGYRPNGLYDSCWVPITQYRMTDLSLPWSTIPSEPVENMGRCLPIIVHDDWISVADDLWRDNVYEGRMNFYVEHNLGPIRNLSDVSLEVYVGDIKPDIFMHPLSGASANDWGSFHQASSTWASVWGGLTSPFGDRHWLGDGYKPTWNDRRGFLRQIPDAQLAFFDSRFARISIFDEEYMKAYDESLPQYIRVIIKRTK